MTRREEVRPGQPPERQHIIGARDHRRVQSFRAADQEAHRPAGGQPALQQARKFLAVRHRAAGIERHDERCIGQRCQQRLAFAPLHLRRRAACLGDLGHRDPGPQPRIVAREQRRPRARRAAGQRRSGAASRLHPLRSHATGPTMRCARTIGGSDGLAYAAGHFRRRRPDAAIRRCAARRAPVVEGARHAVAGARQRHRLPHQLRRAASGPGVADRSRRRAGPDALVHRHPRHVRQRAVVQSVEYRRTIRRW